MNLVGVGDPQRPPKWRTVQRTTGAVERQERAVTQALDRVPNEPPIESADAVPSALCIHRGWIAGRSEHRDVGDRIDKATHRPRAGLSPRGKRIGRLGAPPWAPRKDWGPSQTTLQKEEHGRTVNAAVMTRRRPQPRLRTSRATNVMTPAVSISLIMVFSFKPRIIISPILTIISRPRKSFLCKLPKLMLDDAQVLSKWGAHTVGRHPDMAIKPCAGRSSDPPMALLLLYGGGVRSGNLQRHLLPTARAIAFRSTKRFR